MPQSSLRYTVLLPSADNLESPEPPVFCTPGFKIKKAKSQCSPPAQSSGDPESPGQPRDVPTTPEMPAFQTPYLKHLVSTKKVSKNVEHLVDDILETDSLRSSRVILWNPIF